MTDKQNIIPPKEDLKRILTENDYLMTCPRCDGTGSDPDYIELNNKLYTIQKTWMRDSNNIIFVICNKCYGDGYIDWIDNATGGNENDLEPDLTNIENASIAFLCSAVSGTQSPFDIEDFYDINMKKFIIFPDLVDLDDGLKNFEAFIDLVRQNIKEEELSVFYTAITLDYALDGQICTNCFDLILNKDLIDEIKRRDKLIPAIDGDEIDYYELLKEDKDYPLLRLCDNCKRHLTDKEIILLKKEAFDPSDTARFSDEYRHQIISRYSQ